MTTSVNHQKAVVEVIVIQSLMFDTNYAEFALEFKSKIQRLKKKNILATWYDSNMLVEVAYFMLHFVGALCPTVE